MVRKTLYPSLTAILSLPLATSQITGTGTQSVPDLLSHLLGINVSEPYQILGITATVAVLWVSTYVIFKVGIKKIDEGLERDGHRNSGLANALGIDDSESRNVLAVLTLLIVLTMIGTGAFMGIIRGWQSLILLAFSFALLAGTIFVIIGGTGATIGGTAYVTGKSAKTTARGVEEMQDAVDGFRTDSSSPGDSRRSGSGDSGSGGSGHSGNSGSSGDSGRSSSDSGKQFNDIASFVNNFGEVSNILNTWEKSAVEKIESEINNLEPMDLESENIRVSFLVPSVGDRDSLGDKNAQRAYSLAALYLSIEYDDVYAALDSERSEFTEEGREHAENIIAAVQTLNSISEDSGLEFMNPKSGALYFHPGEGSRPDVPEIVLNYIPDYMNSGDYPEFLRKMLAVRSEENRDNPELESLKDKIMHELTHYYIDKSTGFEMKKKSDLDSGGKPYLDGINEAAAYCVTYIANPELKKGDSPKVGFSQIYRNRSNIPSSIMENSSKAFFKTTEDLEGPDRISKIRELAAKTINQAEDGNMTPVERIAGGELDEELKKAKKFNTAKERANNYISDALSILDIIDGDENFPNSSSTDNLFSSDVGRIEENIKALDRVEDSTGKISALKNDFQELISIYRKEENEFYNEYEIFENEDSKKDLLNNYKAAFFGEFDWNDYIDDRQEDYEELTSRLEEGLSNIISVLSRIHDDEREEAQIIESNTEEFEDLKQLKQDTEEAYEIAKKADKDLEKAMKSIENYQSLGE